MRAFSEGRRKGGWGPPEQPYNLSIESIELQAGTASESASTLQEKFNTTTIASYKRASFRDLPANPFWHRSQAIYSLQSSCSCISLELPSLRHRKLHTFHHIPPCNSSTALHPSEGLTTFQTHTEMEMKR